MDLKRVKGHETRDDIFYRMDHDVSNDDVTEDDVTEVKKILFRAFD